MTNPLQDVDFLEYITDMTTLTIGMFVSLDAAVQKKIYEEYVSINEGYNELNRRFRDLQSNCYQASKGNVSVFLDEIPLGSIKVTELKEDKQVPNNKSNTDDVDPLDLI